MRVVFIALVFVLMSFGGVAAQGSSGQEPASAPHVHSAHSHGPSEVPANDRARGMVYDGLAIGREGTPCEGMFEVVPDRAGQAIGCTHGPDPAPEDVVLNNRRPAASSTAIAESDGIACEAGDDGQSGPRTLGIYAYESDETNVYAQYADSFPVWAGYVEDAFADSAAQTGGERHVRWVHDGNCNLVIDVVQLAPGDLDTIGSMRTALQALGYSSIERKYHVWADSNVYCGVGYIYGDDAPGTETYQNWNDGRASMYSRTDAGCWGYVNSVEAHELMHNLGGVQPSAEFATNGYHCVDNADRMCYSDGGLKPGQVMLNLCPSAEERLFDCNDDDYYNTNPAPGSYLDTHWNTADSRFLFGAATVVTPPLAPSALTASANGADSISLAWQDNSDNEQAFHVERGISGSWSQIASVGAGTTSFQDTGLADETTYDYRVRASNSAGDSAWSAVASTTTEALPAFVDQQALEQMSVLGTATGSLASLADDDGSGQTLTERESGGKPANRHSQMDQQWRFEVQSGISSQLIGSAQPDVSSDGDQFSFQWSTDQSSWSDAHALPSDGSMSMFAANIPASGTVWVRLVDSDQTPGNRALDSVFVDQLMIRTQLDQATSPPAAPSGLSAASTSSSSVSLSWTDNAVDETAYHVERSLDGSSWSEVALLPANSQSFSDAGLAAETTYHYRVVASNAAGSAQSGTAFATTDAAPPAVHVSDIDGTSSGKKRWSATSTITIEDAMGSSVAGAVVSGTWSTGQAGSCTTDASGSCSIQQGGIRGASVTFAVTDVQSTSAYDASANSDPDGDSDGTTIVIAAP